MLPLIKDIFQAMVYLEKCHIIHRDIKAANIFIKENRAIVADFGFARYVNEPFYDLNIGSLPFMPP
jgi:serine/threonine protein kinase